VFRRFYRTVVDRSAPVEYPTFEDGIRQMRILDAVLEGESRPQGRLAGNVTSFSF
jgi:hypothetical protein